MEYELIFNALTGFWRWKWYELDEEDSHNPIDEWYVR